MYYNLKSIFKWERYIIIFWYQFVFARSITFKVSRLCPKSHCYSASSSSSPCRLSEFRRHLLCFLYRFLNHYSLCSIHIALFVLCSWPRRACWRRGPAIWKSVIISFVFFFLHLLGLYLTTNISFFLNSLWILLFEWIERDLHFVCFLMLYFAYSVDNWDHFADTVFSHPFLLLFQLLDSEGVLSLLTIWIYSFHSVLLVIS